MKDDEGQKQMLTTRKDSGIGGLDVNCAPTERAISVSRVQRRMGKANLWGSRGHTTDPTNPSYDPHDISTTGATDEAR